MSSSAPLRRTDLQTLCNLRNDGRKINELRKMTIQISPLSHSNHVSGSALVTMGLTMALAVVSGPMDCSRKSDELPDRATLDVEFRVTPFANTSADRRRVQSNTDRTLIEQSQLLHKALEAALFLQLHPRTRISVTVYILSEDGGRLVAGINAASLACIDAGIEMRDVLCACSTGLIDPSVHDEDNLPLLDLNANEIKSMGDGMSTGVHMIVATLPQRDTLVLSQCDSRLSSLTMLEKLIHAGMEGCRQVFAIMEAGIRDHVNLFMAAKNGQAQIQLTNESLFATF